MGVRNAAVAASGQWVDPDVQPESGRHAEEVRSVCRRCRAGLGARRDERGWTRTDPRP